MKNNYSKINFKNAEILIFDNNVLIYLFNETTAKETNKLFEILSLKGFWILIPGTVKKEFFGKELKKNKKVLKENMKKFKKVIDCPYKISNNEIVLLVPNNDKNKGEADAILQAKKIITMSYASKISFVTNDEKAIKLAEKYKINVIPYCDFISDYYKKNIKLFKPFNCEKK
jgi:predicted nucleic acid-binding protein